MVMDTITLHELELSIADETIVQRFPEWNAGVNMARSRSEYIKGMAAFCGLELVEYEVAQVSRPPRSNHFVLKAFSDQWVLRQPK